MLKPKENAMLREMLAGLARMRLDHPKGAVIPAGPTGSFLKANSPNLLGKNRKNSHLVAALTKIFL